MTIQVSSSSSSSSSSRYNVPKISIFALVLFVVVPAYIGLHFGSLVVLMTRTVHVHYPPTSPQTNVILKEGLPISSSNDMDVFQVTAPLISSSIGNDNNFSCRLTKELSLGPSMIMEEQPPVICVSYVNGEENDDFVLDEYLSRELYDRHNFHHDMFVTMTGVAVEKKTRTLTGNENTVITIVDAPLQHARRVTEASKGNYTLAIVRVSTPDSQLQISTQELRDQVLNDSEGAVNVITQYRAISFRKFQLQSNGVHDVYVNKSILEYPHMSGMYDDIAAAAIEQLGVAHISNLADKVMICHPPGHTSERIAWTHHLGWRAHYKEEWCASLSANMHEMGHQIGIGHAHIVRPDAHDQTSYMGSSILYRTSPRQTFNGPHNWFLGWFEKRTKYIDPLVDNPLLVPLAALVDFKITKAHQPVILVIGTGDEAYYLQYNRAKGFNNETWSFKDWVTIHTSDPYAATTIKGGIRLNEYATDDRRGSTRLPLFTATNYSGSGRDLLIQVCDDLPGNEKRRPDVMVISVGLGKTLCNVTADDEDDDEGDSFDESWKDVRAPSSSSAKAAPAPRPTNKKMKRTKAPATATPNEAPKKRMMRRSKAPTTTSTPSESPLTKESQSLRRPSPSPTNSPSFAPSTSSPSVAPATAWPTRDVPGGTSPRPFPTTGSGQDSYSYMYIISLLLAAIGAWGVFVFLY